VIELYVFISIVIIIMLERFKQNSVQSDNEFQVMVFYIYSVFFHELAHYVTSMILLGRPSGMTIVPQRNEYTFNDGTKHVMWEFGSVNHNNANFINAFYIGLSPLFLIFLAYFIYSNFFYYFEPTGLNIILLHLLVFVLVSNSLPSSVDFKLAFKYLYGVALNMSFIGIAYIYFPTIQGVFYETKSLINSVIF
jgi:hypothetical protein